MAIVVLGEAFDVSPSAPVRSALVRTIEFAESRLDWVSGRLEAWKHMLLPEPDVDWQWTPPLTPECQDFLDDLKRNGPHWDPSVLKSS